MTGSLVLQQLFSAMLEQVFTASCYSVSVLLQFTFYFSVFIA